MSDPVRSEDSAPTLSTRAAYHRLLTLFFGAHRFYVGKWLTALLYPALAFGVIPVAVFLWEDGWYYFVGLYALLLAVDAALIPRWVRRRNAWLAEDFKVHPNRYLIPTTDDIAPWARGHARKHHWHVFRNYFFFWVVPLLTGVWAAQLHSLELMIVPIVVLAAIGLISTLDRILAHHPAVQEIPGVGPAIERVADMRAHFWDEEPKILSAVWGLFRHAKKFRPYWTLALIVAATVVIEGVISFNDNNRHLEPLDAGLIIGITAVLAGIVALVNLVPITALSFHYSLSGRRTRLRFMTLGAVIATLFGYNLSSLEEGQDGGAGKIPSFVSSWRLEKRMENPEFRDELRNKMDIFLWYYHDIDVDIAEVNQAFRDLLRGLVPNDEADAFQVIDTGDWALVVYHNYEGRCNLQAVGAEVDPNAAEAPKYSPLAFVFKNTEEMKRARLELVWEEADDEDIDPLYVIDQVSRASIFYRWDESLNDFIPNPGCHSLLYDWEPSGDDSSGS